MDDKEVKRREKHFLDLLSKYNKSQEYISTLEAQLKDEREWFDRKVDLNVKLIKELGEKEAQLKELREGIEELIAYGMPKHIENGLNELISK